VILDARTHHACSDIWKSLIAYFSIIGCFDRVLDYMVSTIDLFYLSIQWGIYWNGYLYIYTTLTPFNYRLDKKF